MQQAIATRRIPPFGIRCVTGRFNLLFFIQGGVSPTIVPPVGGDVIGQITPLGTTTPIPVIQTQPTNIPLSQVDNRLVTLCGFFVLRGGRVVLDVRLVFPVSFGFGKGFPGLSTTAGATALGTAGTTTTGI